MASRRVATPDSVAVFGRRYATRSSLGHGSVDWKSTATIGHRYAVSRTQRTRRGCESLITSQAYGIGYAVSRTQRTRRGATQ